MGCGNLDGKKHELVTVQPSLPRGIPLSCLFFFSSPPSHLPLPRLYFSIPFYICPPFQEQVSTQESLWLLSSERCEGGMVGGQGPRVH